VDNEKEEKPVSRVSFSLERKSRKTFGYLSLFMDEEGYIVLFYFLLSFNGQEIAVQAQGCAPSPTSCSSTPSPAKPT
jgi:hypothetical protein